MHCPVSNLFVKCCCSKGIICQFCIRLTLAVIGILFGALIAWKPKKTIEMQTAFYRPFNWKLEPISMEKEIRNMRIMGLTIIALGIISLLCIFII